MDDVMPVTAISNREDDGRPMFCWIASRHSWDKPERTSYVLGKCGWIPFPQKKANIVIGSPLLEATGKATITDKCSTVNITWHMAINDSKWRLLVGHQLEMVDFHCHCWPGFFHATWLRLECRADWLSEDSGQWIMMIYVDWCYLLKVKNTLHPWLYIYIYIADICWYRCIHTHTHIYIYIYDL